MPAHTKVRPSSRRPKYGGASRTESVDAQALSGRLEEIVRVQLFIAWISGSLETEKTIACYVLEEIGRRYPEFARYQNEHLPSTTRRQHPREFLQAFLVWTGNVWTGNVWTGNVWIGDVGTGGLAPSHAGDAAPLDLLQRKVQSDPRIRSMRRAWEHLVKGMKSGALAHYPGFAEWERFVTLPRKI